MASIWSFADLREADFVVTACLLALQEQQQRPSPKHPKGHDDGDDESEHDLSPRDSMAVDYTATSSSVSTIATLKEKFLDRLAEVLAQEKPSPASRMKGSRHKIDAQHVAAAAWLDYQDDKKVIVLIAKNHGLDEADSKLLCVLERWLQCIARTPRHPRIGGDTLWYGRAGTTGLLEYYRVRLEYYISTIQVYADDRFPASTGNTEPTAEKIHHSRALCKAYNNEQASARQQHEIVTATYELRYEDFQRSCTLATDSDKFVKTVCMLGRLRAAYDTFKEAAVQFKALANVEIKLSQW
jgi:hypothetical protein